MQVPSRGVILIFFFLLLPALSLPADESPAPESPTVTSAEPPVHTLFRDQFYLSPVQKLRHNTFQADGFLLIERPTPEWNSGISIVSGFARGALRTRVLKDVQTVEQAKDWIKKEKQTTAFEGVPIHRQHGFLLR